MEVLDLENLELYGTLFIRAVYTNIVITATSHIAGYTSSNMDIYSKLVMFTPHPPPH